VWSQPVNLPVPIVSPIPLAEREPAAWSTGLPLVVIRGVKA
jgi:hypothetical protein